MKQFTHPIQIWFLDDDLNLSAQYLTNRLLSRTISGCMQALIATRYYFLGIHNKKAYKFYFDKERLSDTMDQYFPFWPLKNKPNFTLYSSRESKWTRKCKEHYDYIKRYLEILLEEYQYRFSKEHGLSKFIEWLEFDAPVIDIPNSNIKQITIPWKAVDKKYRRANIIDSYRLQFMNTLGTTKPEDAFLKTKRDIPSFVVKHFNIGNSMMT